MFRLSKNQCHKKRTAKSQGIIVQCTLMFCQMRLDVYEVLASQEVFTSFRQVTQLHIELRSNQVYRCVHSAGALGDTFAHTHTAWVENGCRKQRVNLGINPTFLAHTNLSHRTSCLIYKIRSIKSTYSSHLGYQPFRILPQVASVCSERISSLRPGPVHG